MSCLVRHPKSPYWICSFTSADGRRLKKSTKQTNKEAAKKVCMAFQEAEQKISAHGADEKVLRRFMDDALSRLGHKKLSEESVRQTLQTWIDTKEGASAEATVKAYRQAAQLLNDFLGKRADESIRGVTKRDVIEFRRHLSSQGKSHSTSNKIKMFLSAPFESAKQEGLIDTNPFRLVDNLRFEKTEKEAFSPEDIARLLSVADRDWQGAIVLGFTSAARLRDVANMRWSNVDTENGVLSFVERKTRKKALLGLHPDFVDWISDQTPMDDPRAFLFPNLANREVNGAGGLSNEFLKIMKKAGITGKELRAEGGKRVFSSLSFHSLRHSAASVVYGNAALESITRQVTGHRSDALKNYVHKDLEVLKQATKLIPRIPKAV